MRVFPVFKPKKRSGPRQKYPRDLNIVYKFTSVWLLFLYCRLRREISHDFVGLTVYGSSKRVGLVIGVTGGVFFFCMFFILCFFSVAENTFLTIKYIFLYHIDTTRRGGYASRGKSRASADVSFWQRVEKKKINQYRIKVLIWISLPSYYKEEDRTIVGNTIIIVIII